MQLAVLIRDAGVEQQGLQALQAELIVIDLLQALKEPAAGVLQGKLALPDDQGNIVQRRLFLKHGQQDVRSCTADDDGMSGNSF
ncbi:MAG: hypothetical protein LRY36_01695, partial [Alphaproteobacteria bacterium]|nr:hypothetical protein [Alphaproteobacteria bacterium]